jgi:hypothetical protein
MQPKKANDKNPLKQGFSIAIFLKGLSFDCIDYFPYISCNIIHIITSRATIGLDDFDCLIQHFLTSFSVSSILSIDMSAPQPTTSLCSKMVNASPSKQQKHVPLSFVRCIGAVAEMKNASHP